MRPLRLVVPALLLLTLASSLAAQPPAAPQLPVRDARAVAALEQSMAAMGGRAPADLTATGTVTVTAGTSTENGSMRVLTRGLDQSKEEISTADGVRATIYSRGKANIPGKPVSLELAASSYTSFFPLAYFQAAYEDSEWALEYVGLETVEKTQAHRIRLWNTFASNIDLRTLAEFTRREVWIDAVTALPLKVSFEMRAGGDAAPRIPVEVSFSDFRNVGGVSFPHRIEKWLNGVPVIAIQIQNVTLNSNLTDADFPITKVTR